MLLLTRLKSRTVSTAAARFSRKPAFMAGFLYVRILA
jgi:hypothetical protein